MKKNFVVAVVLVLVFALALIGCSSDKGNDSKDAEKPLNNAVETPAATNEEDKDGAAEKESEELSGELSIAYWDASFKDQIDYLIGEFTKVNPDLKVTANITPWKDYWTMLQTSLAGGSGPDVFWMNGSNVHKYATLGQIKDLEGLVARDNVQKSDYNDLVVDLYSVNNKLYGMPYFSDAVALYYNKKIFDDAGVDYPTSDWTWKELRESALKLTDESKGIFGYIAPTGGHIGYYNLIAQAGGKVISDDKKKSGFDSPEALEAIQFMLDMMYVDKSTPNAAQQIETPATELFASNRLAMFPAVSPNTKPFYEAIGDQLGIVELPAGKQEAAVVHGIAWVMNEKAKNESAAWEFMKYMTGEESAKEYAKVGAGNPAYKGVDDIWTDVHPNLDKSAILRTYDIGVPFPISQKTADWNAEQNTIMEQIFMQKLDPAEGLKQLAEKMNEILATEE